MSALLRDIPAEPIPNLLGRNDSEACLAQTGNKLLVIKSLLPGMVEQYTAESWTDDVAQRLCNFLQSFSRAIGLLSIRRTLFSYAAHSSSPNLHPDVLLRRLVEELRSAHLCSARPAA